TNSSFTNTFNITGVPNENGTILAITANCQKGITSGTQVHTCIFQINGGTIATEANTTNTTAQQEIRSFILARINGAWALLGEGPAAAPANTASTQNTADFAEWIDYSGNDKPQPGDVLSLGSSVKTVKDSSTPYDQHLLGV